MYPTFLLLKHKEIDFTNTVVSLRDDRIKVDRTQFVGFDLTKYIPDIPLPQLLQDLGSTKKSKEEEDHEVEILPEPKQEFIAPRINTTGVQGDHKASLFTSVDGEIRVANYFLVPSRTISWNQTALLFLLLTEKEMNNRQSIDLDEYMSLLTKSGLPSTNWSSSTAKFFARNGNELTCIAPEAKEAFLAELVSFRANCIVSLEKLIGKCEEKNYVRTTSNYHLLYTIAAIVFSESTTISLDAMYEILRENKISSSNYVSSITSSTLRALICLDKEGRKLTLNPHKDLAQVLLAHKGLFKQFYKGPAKQMNLPEGETVIQTPSMSKDIVLAQFQQVLGGYGNVAKDKDGELRIFVRAPKSLTPNDIKGRRNMILLCLSGLKDIGVNEASFQTIRNMLLDNRAGNLALPRDVALKRDFFIYNKAERTFSVSNSQEAKSLVKELLSYRVSQEDMTSKMQELLPLMREIIKTHPKGFITRSDFCDKCREKSIVINIPRDVPRVFGFFYENNFYFSASAIEAVSGKARQPQNE